jgi:hypothetical protein
MGRGVRGRRVILAAAAAGLVVGTAALASGSAVPVKLKLVGASDLEIGQSAKLTASAKLPKGARLLIQALPSGRAPTKVAECLRSPCSGSYRDSREEGVDFQASAIKRVGRKVTTLGRSNRVAVFWSEPAPPPPPPPPPAATPGHYVGKTADNELWAFDIGTDGLSMTNLQTGQINESCEPPAYLSGGNLTFWGPIPVARDGSFAISTTLNGTVDNSPASDTIKITGRIAGGTASGTYRVDTSFSANGQGYSCSSGDQAWTASRA